MRFLRSYHSTRSLTQVYYSALKIYISCFRFYFMLFWILSNPSRSHSVIKTNYNTKWILQCSSKLQQLSSFLLLSQEQASLPHKDKTKDFWLGKSDSMKTKKGKQYKRKPSHCLKRQANWHKHIICLITNIIPSSNSFHCFCCRRPESLVFLNQSIHYSTLRIP